MRFFIVINHHLFSEFKFQKHNIAEEITEKRIEIARSRKTPGNVCNKKVIYFLESRQGWKTSGNGYFVYKASTSFNSTNKLEISGKFSTKANSQIDNVIIAAEDANGILVFQYSVDKGKAAILSLTIPAKFI